MREGVRLRGLPEAAAPEERTSRGIEHGKGFNDVVDMDAYHVLVGRKKFKVLALLDEYTRYEVDQVIGREACGSVVNALVKGWTSTFGSMRMLRTDMAGAHTSESMKDFCTA